VDESGVIRTQVRGEVTKQIRKWTECMGRFVQYHSVTTTCNDFLWRDVDNENVEGL
jgi:hypothetical protein